ncbi:beta-galactosidase [Cohnella soli]|uniref:Beta-galactosidase n=1 Tax=Cohnella soli TaxID=425005 RepID=A0ABW0HYU9_9BACL
MRIMTKRQARMRKPFIGIIGTMIAIAVMVMPQAAGAVALQADPFPIGVGAPPYPDRYQEDAIYTEMKDFGATFVMGGNGANTLDKVSNLMDATYRNGLKAFSYDDSLDFNRANINQLNGGSGLYVSSTNPIGQTFTSPSGSNWLLSTVTLNLDPRYWVTGADLTMTLYEFGTPSSPRGLQLGSYTITAAHAVAQPAFILNKYLQSGHSYYLELTSTASWGVGWVSYTANSASYGGGTAYENRVAGGGDLYFKMNFSQYAYEDNGRPSDSVIDNIADHFKTHPGLFAHFVNDEPSGQKFARLQAMIERFRLKDPGHGTYVNLFPTYASNFQIGMDQAQGEYVTPTQSLGQKFKTNSKTSYISAMQLNIDSSQWESNEYLSLKLWDSPAKNTLIAQSPNYAKPANNRPQFVLNATVSPNTSYFAELVHAGGGNGIVGWVVRSVLGTKYYKDGQAYVNGNPINSDFWMTINQNISTLYEDYVYKWVATEPDVLSFDHYPFRVGGGVTTDYFTNLEVVRRQSLLGQVEFWAYLQSQGEPGYLRVPNQHEMRFQIYTNLAYGAKGLQYFMYWNVDPAETSFTSGILDHNGNKIMAPDGLNTMYEYDKQINQEVLKLGPTLKTLTSQAVYHTGTLPADTTALPASFFLKPDNAADPLLIGYFTDANDRKFVLVVNRDTVNPRTVSFTLSPKPSTVKEISKSNSTETATNYNSSTGQMSASFTPGEGKLFALPSGY